MGLMIARERILTHGLNIASSHGLDALSIGELARLLQVEKSGVAVHFRSKESLQLGVLGQAADVFTRDVVQPSQTIADGEARVKEMFVRWVRWSLSPTLSGGCPFVHASRDTHTLAPEVRAKLDNFLSAWSDLFVDAINVSKGKTLDPKIDTEQMIFEIFGLYLSHHFFHWSRGDSNAHARTMTAFNRLLANARIKAN